MRKKVIRQYATKLYAFLAVLFWASAFVSTKMILQNGRVSAMDLGTLRYLFAGLLLLPVIVFLHLRLPKFQDFGKFLLSGCFGYAVYMFFFNTASTMITPSTASVINAICPGVTALLAYFIFRERIRPLGIFALFVSFSGILILCLWNNQFSVNVGVFYMLGGAFCLSAYNITQRWFVQRYTAIEVMAYSLLSGSILLFVFHISSLKLLPQLEISDWGHLIYLAVFPSIISYYCWAKAMECCTKTSEVTNFMFVTPLLASLLSFYFIGEFSNISTYIGGGMILLGMFLFQLTSKKE